MKKIIVLGILSLTIQMYGEVKPLKRANMIIVSSNYISINDALSGVQKLLIDNNIIPEKVDKEFGFIVTSNFISGKSINKVTLSFFEKEDTILIKIFGIYQPEINIAFSMSGVTAVNIDKNEIENKGMSGSYLKDAWDGMRNLSLIIPHSKIQYEIFKNEREIIYRTVNKNNDPNY